MTAGTARRVRMTGRLLAALAAGLWFVVLLAPGASASPRSTPTSTAAPAKTTSCPADATCRTIPSHCPKAGTCPEVIISPASNLGTNQWVFLTAEHFPPNAPIYAYYCSDKYSLAKRDPLCMLQATPELLNPQIVLTASPQGTASISFETEENPNDGNTALVAKIPGTQTTGSFFCDDAPDPCSIDVTDPLLDPSGTTNLVLSPTNAVAVPVTFAKPTGGCPNATFVPTASEFGIDRLFPVAAQFDCVGTTPAIAVNFAKDSLAAVTAVVGGESDIAFIDDPNSQDVQAELAQLNSGSSAGYTIIPVALSSQVIAFKATMSDDQTARIFPDNSFELTPTMVAGLVTDYYSFVSGADVANCGSAEGGQCSLLNALNTINGFRGAGEFGGYVRADTSSSTSEVFNWLCDAPRVAVPLGRVKVREQESAASVLITGLEAGGAKDVKSCPDTDVFPSLLKTFAWVAASDPSTQSTKLSAFVPPPNASISAVAGFAPMNASEANYYGLLPAALQNRAGKFVLPTAKSLDAAVSVAWHNSNGTLSPRFTTKDPAAYPLPDIWYAVVPTANLSTTSALADQTLLDDVLRLSAGRQTADLPPGFVPLPNSLHTQAVAAIDNDIVAAPPPPPATTTTTTRPTVTATTRPKVTATTQPKVTATTTPKAPPTTIAFQSTAFAVAGHSDSWLAPAFVSVLAGAMLFGPGLLLKSRRRSGGVI